MIDSGLVLLGFSILLNVGECLFNLGIGLLKPQVR